MNEQTDITGYESQSKEATPTSSGDTYDEPEPIKRSDEWPMPTAPEEGAPREYGIGKPHWMRLRARIVPESEY